MGSDKGLAPDMRQAIIWTNGYIIYWRIYATVCLDELNTECPYTDHGDVITRAQL